CPVKALSTTIFDVAGVRPRGVSAEPNTVCEIGHSSNVAVGDLGLDAVSELSANPAFLSPSLEEAFEGRRSKLDRKFASISDDRRAADDSGRIQRIAVARGAKRGRTRHSKPRAEVQR